MDEESQEEFYKLMEKIQHLPGYDYGSDLPEDLERKLDSFLEKINKTLHPIVFNNEYINNRLSQIDQKNSALSQQINVYNQKVDNLSQQVSTLNQTFAQLTTTFKKLEEGINKQLNNTENLAKRISYHVGHAMEAAFQRQKADESFKEVLHDRDNALKKSLSDLPKSTAGIIWERQHEEMTIAHLKKLAAEKHIKIYSYMNKKQIMTALKKDFFENLENFD